MNTQRLKKQCSMACGYSGARLALNYYMLEDGILDEQHMPEGFLASLKLFRTYLGAYLKGETLLAETDGMRRKMIHEMEIITAYADCFQLYEYALNRLERRYLTDLAAVDTEGIVEELMQFVVNTKDAFVMNGRIQQIIAQLPVRFTRHKFYTMVRDALSVYTDGQRTSLENLMYMLRTSAMTNLPADMATGYEDLYEILERFRGLDFKTLDGDGYRTADQQIAYVSGRLNVLSSWYVTFQDVINDFYVLLLTREYAVTDVEETARVQAILRGVLQMAEQSGNELPEDGLMAELEGLEGVQEAYYEKYQRAAAQNPDPESAADQEDGLSRQLDLLLSGSSFVTLDQSPQTGETADAAWIDETANAFFGELDQLFSGIQRPVMRAVMAKVLAELPIAFNRLDEVQAYITASLDSCADHAEKETCIELLRQLMESEYASV